ncbi:HAD hydrolase family protein [Mycoplasma sp. NEAQ87857]|uniref:HAD hydrolase family protein n=1 Tax=Mycoplasma sp. NEAQ87857 TaxID=2683967 RepID=UPI00131C51A7|nr:HAD family hydrolase [Mycoplasma sp. NEAQ87857]
MNWGIMQKVFAYDLDGTLLMKDNTVHPYTQKCLKMVQDKNHINVIATGRGIKKVIPLIENGIIKNMDYIVFSNGAGIYNIQTKEIHLINNLDPKIFDMLYQKALQYNLILTIDTINYNGTILPNNDYPRWMSKEQIMDMNILNVASYYEIKSLIHTQPNSVTQLALRNPLKLAAQITDEVKKSIDLDKYEVYLTNSVYTDVNPKNTSKLNGLKYLLKLLNTNTDSLIAFGDSGNDVPMLYEAKIGVSLGNGTKEAKEVSNLIIGDHESPTIGHTILSLID